VLLYQSCHLASEPERFRFKLVQSQVLVKPHTLCPSSASEGLSQESFCLEPKMAIVLHPCQPFAIFMRHGRPVCVDIGPQQGPCPVSLVFFQTGFLMIDKEQTSAKIVRFPPRFDPRVPSVKLCDSYFLKQLVFKDKGIKKLKIFSPYVNTAKGKAAFPAGEEPKGEDCLRQYIFLATY